MISPHDRTEVASSRAEPPTRPWDVNAAVTSRWPALRFGQLWTHRELVYFFALRDLKVRYKQAFLGVAWAGNHALPVCRHTVRHFQKIGDQ